MRDSRRLFCSNRSRPCTRTRGHRSPIFDFKLLNAMLVDGDCKWLAIQPLTALLELRRETASHPGRAKISENRGVRACFGDQSGIQRVLCAIQPGENGISNAAESTLRRGLILRSILPEGPILGEALLAVRRSAAQSGPRVAGAGPRGGGALPLVSPVRSPSWRRPISSRRQPSSWFLRFSPWRSFVLA